jgi:hypothetical protein
LVTNRDAHVLRTIVKARQINLIFCFAMKTYLIAFFLVLSVTAFQAQSAESNPPVQNQAPARSSGPIVSNIVKS